MKRLKKTLATLAVIGGVAIGGLGVWASELGEERVGSPDGNTIEVSGDGVEASTDALEITSSVSGGVVHIAIENTSKEDVKNLSVVYDDSNSLASYQRLYEIGTVPSGETRYYDLATIRLGNGIFRTISDGVGGFRYLMLLIPVIVIGVGVTSSVIIVRVKLRKRKWNVLIGIIGGLVTVLGVVGTYVGLHYTRGVDEYAMLDTGENYNKSLIVDLGSLGTVNFDIKYNQDIVTYTVTEKDVEIPFEVEYEYDETIECTSESSIKSAGQLGKKHVVTTTIYRNGEKDSETSEESVITKPVNQIEVQGTKTVIETQNVEAYREYVPDDTMYVGQFQLETSAEEAKSHIGKKEITWNWDKNTNKLVSSELVTQQPGTDTWKAGILVEVTETLKAKTEYIPAESQGIGYENVLSENVDGSRSTVYKAEIDPATGLRADGTELEFVSSETVSPTNGQVEIGVMRTEDITTPCEEDVQYDESQWSNYERVLVEGVDQVERVVSIMKLDKATGQVTDQVEKEASRTVIQEPVTREVIRGSKEPTWVEEKLITGEVEYNTVYVADESLSGDEQVIAQEGEKGSLYTTQLIAVDEAGNPIEGYEPQIVQEDALSAPVDEIIHVAPDSPLLD